MKRGRHRHNKEENEDSSVIYLIVFYITYSPFPMPNKLFKLVYSQQDGKIFGRLFLHLN
jgi:hypothetical protein